MTERARHRLTGAIFLIALAAVLVPMLFDGPREAPPPLPPLEAEAIDTAEVAAPKIDEAALAEAEALRERVDDEGFDVETGVRVGEPTLADADAPAAAPAEAWAIQVASFSEHANAVKLRDRLLADGYAAFLSERKSGTGRSTRVAVGPLIERTEAERLRTELGERYKASALVVRFEQ